MKEHLPDKNIYQTKKEKKKYSNSNSAVLGRIFIPLNWYGRPKNEPKFLKTSPFFFYFYQFNNCPFALPNYFIILFSCLASKSTKIEP